MVSEERLPISRELPNGESEVVLGNEALQLMVEIPGQDLEHPAPKENRSIQA